MNPDRAAMLLAFKEESEVLTRQQIMNRAFVWDRQKFQSIVESRFIEPLPWVPGDVPREFVLTKRGCEHRALQLVVENYGYG